MTIKKVILIGLIVIMLEAIGGYIYLTYRKEIPSINIPTSSQSAEVKSIDPQSKPLLALKTDLDMIKKNGTFTVSAVLEGNGNNASASDLTIRYDPKMVALVATNSAKPFTESPIFQKTVYNSLDAKTGLATVSAVSETEQSLPERGFLTTMIFKALKVGPTEITIVFTPGETRDTNIVSESKDILGSVENLSLNIQP